MKVDAHVHVWPAASRLPDDDATLTGSSSAESFAEIAERADVGAAVFVQPSRLGLDHTYLMNTVRAAGARRAAGVAQANPVGEDSVAVITALATRQLIAGFRLPLLHSTADWLRAHGAEYWPIAETHRQVVSLLISPDQLGPVDEAATVHPGVSLVVEHLARLDLSTDRPGDLARLCRLARHENVYVKVSVLALLTHGTWPYRDTWADVFAVLDAFGPDRVIWGSDFPFVLAFGPYEQAIGALVHALDEFDPTIAPRFFMQNALDLYFSGSTESR